MSENPSALRKLSTVLLVIAGIVAAASYPAAFAVDRAAGREVTLLAVAFDEAQVLDNRDQFDDSIQDPGERREAIVEIYGSTPTIETSRVLFAGDAELIRPLEDPTLLLLPPARDGAHRIQAKSAFFVAKMATIGAAVALVVLLVVRRFLR